MIALELPTLEKRWALKADLAACYGVHYRESDQLLVSHGELEITRLDDAGNILWSFSGKDIFSGAFRLGDTCIVVVDDSHREYKISLDTGKGTIRGS